MKANTKSTTSTTDPSTMKPTGILLGSLGCAGAGRPALVPGFAGSAAAFPALSASGRSEGAASVAGTASAGGADTVSSVALLDGACSGFFWGSILFQYTSIQTVTLMLLHDELLCDQFGKYPS